jgi:nicotinic acid mononucleotide adenylyltransferase
MYRAGCPRPDFSPFACLWGAERVERLHDHVIETPLVDISSTLVRQRLGAGQDVTAMLHPAVLEYIQRHGLYR